MFLVGQYNDWSKWFASSSFPPIYSLSFSFMGWGYKKMWITKLRCEKYFWLGALKGPGGGSSQSRITESKVSRPILQTKWSNKQMTKVLCIKVHFVHFYPSNECCVKNSFFSTTCVCVFYFFHTHQRPKPKTFFFFWGWVGTSFARDIDDGYIGF